MELCARLQGTRGRDLRRIKGATIGRAIAEGSYSGNFGSGSGKAESKEGGNENENDGDDEEEDEDDDEEEEEDEDDDYDGNAGDAGHVPREGRQASSASGAEYDDSRADSQFEAAGLTVPLRYLREAARGPGAEIGLPVSGSRGYGNKWSMDASHGGANAGSLGSDHKEGSESGALHGSAGEAPEGTGPGLDSESTALADLEARQLDDLLHFGGPLGPDYEYSDFQCSSGVHRMHDFGWD